MLRVFRSLAILARQLREDSHVYGGDWSLPGLRALAVQRFGAWVYRELGRGVVRYVFKRVHRTMFRYVRNRYGIEVYATTVVGRRFLIGHQSGIVIHPNAVIGDDCVVRQNVTIGASTRARVLQAPTLGRRVEVGCGAVILGGVKIGDDAKIGPNTVVMSDVPPGASVFVERPRMILAPAPPREASAAEPQAVGGGH